MRAANERGHHAAGVGLGARSARQLRVAVLTAVLLLAALVVSPIAVTTAEGASTGSLSGRLTVPKGHSAAGIVVRAYLLGVGSQGEKYYSDVGVAATTAADGKWRIGGLADGTYRVGFTTSPSGNVVGGFLGGATKYQGTDVVVKNGAAVGGLNETLALGAVITGRVKSEGGTPLGGMRVAAYEADDDFGFRTWRLVRGTHTDEHGRYRIDQLRGREHRIGFVDPEFYRYHTEYYRNAPSVEKGKSVSLRAGRTVAGISARLAGGPGWVPLKKLKRVKAPKVTGKAKVGRVLRVSKGTWKPRKVRVKYRWYAKKGKKVVKVKAGTKSKLTLKRSMRGKKYRVVVKVAKKGHRTVKFTSTWSKKVKR